MTITYINEALSYVAPAPDIIRGSRAELVKKLAGRNEVYLPQLKQQLNALDQILHRLDGYARETLATVPVALETGELSEMLERRGDVSGLQPHTLAKSVTEEYESEISEILGSCFDTLDERASALSALVAQLSSWTLGDASSFLADHDRQLAAIQQALDALSRECADLEMRKQQLNDALKVYEEKTVLDRWTPILEDLVKLKPTSPAFATLQGAVIGVKNILDIASDAIKHGDLVEARELLRGNLNGKRLQMSEHKDQIRILTSRSNQIRALQGIDGAKLNYEQEVRKIADALQTFLTLRERQINEPVADFARRFIMQAGVFSNWVSKVLKTWK